MKNLKKTQNSALLLKNTVSKSLQTLKLVTLPGKPAAFAGKSKPIAEETPVKVAKVAINAGKDAKISTNSASLRKNQRKPQDLRQNSGFIAKFALFFEFLDFFSQRTRKYGFRARKPRQFLRNSRVPLRKRWKNLRFSRKSKKNARISLKNQSHCWKNPRSS